MSLILVRQKNQVVKDLESSNKNNNLHKVMKRLMEEAPKVHIERQGKFRMLEPVGLDCSRRSDDGSDSLNSVTRARRKSTALIISLVMFLGTGTCAAFLARGISSSKTDQSRQFDRSAEDLVNQIQRAWEDYATAAAWIHGRCRSENFTRADFRTLYEYLINSGLDFQAAQFDPNITHSERPAAEAEARAFYEANYPSVNYPGFVGFNNKNNTAPEPREEAEYYFPIHYMEPVVGNEPAIDLDYAASGSRRQTVLFCIENGLPALTDRLVLVQETTETAFGVVLMHPGFALKPVIGISNGETDAQSQEDWPKDLASIVIRIPDLLRRAAQDQTESSVVYIYDASDSNGSPVFLGGAKILASSTNTELIFLPELEMDDLRENDFSHTYDEIVQVANKEWIVVVQSLEGTYKPDLVFVLCGGVIIFIASVALAYWIYTNSTRMDAFNRLRSQAEAEKATLILDNARKATKAERELNDFIAHEVRNPVAAAMSACSFVKANINETEPLQTEESRVETRDDVEIIDNALRFVNDLLRNMLDMHRASNKQLKVNMTPADVLHDVLEPVQAMLPQHDPKFQVVLDCPEGLVIMTDRLRLKQVCLNLGRNSVKFVDKGFIRLKAEVVQGRVQIYVDDSGPGIPQEKRESLFAKFQESLDCLSQGTGIGLFLCQNLVELMDGEIHLDTMYDSGVEGCPGSRFVVNLKQELIDPRCINDYHPASIEGTGETYFIDSDVEKGLQAQVPQELPESLSVLFVDDDPILRKLFSRTIRKVAAGWKVREAGNGETALRLVDEEKFDLIFMDNYMASVEKQLLGTETVRELRSKGVDCRICGLSANDKESEFLDAGADVFTLKPFPCETKAITQELKRVLFKDGKKIE